MVFAVKKVKKKCEICGKEFEYNSYGNVLSEQLHTIYDIKTGELIGYEVGNRFICKDCLPRLIGWVVKMYKLKEGAFDALMKWILEGD